MKHSKFFVLIIISIFSTGCFCVKNLPQSKLNPTEYVFPISKSALTDSLTNKKDYYFNYKFSNVGGVWYKKDGDYFDVHSISGSDKTYGGSYVYRKRDHGKHCFYKFKVKIDSLSSDSCRVRIIYDRVELCTRVAKMVDMWYIANKLVTSSTIEEYEILRKFGKRLGILNQMPLVSYPEGLTRDQIRMTYGHKQDFTYEEMFGEPQPESEKDPEYTKKELKKRRKKGLRLTKFDYYYCK